MGNGRGIGRGIPNVSDMKTERRIMGAENLNTVGT